MHRPPHPTPNDRPGPLDWSSPDWPGGGSEPYFSVAVDAARRRIAVNGLIDRSTAEVIGECIDHLLAMNHRRVTVDLTGAEMVLAAAMRRLDAATTAAERHGTTLVLQADAGCLARRMLAVWTRLHNQLQDEPSDTTTAITGWHTGVVVS